MKTIHRQEIYDTKDSIDPLLERFEALEKNIRIVGQTVNDNTHDLTKKIEDIDDWIDYFRKFDLNTVHPGDRLDRMSNQIQSIYGRIGELARDIEKLKGVKKK